MYLDLSFIELLTFFCSDGPPPQSRGLMMRCLLRKQRSAKSIHNQISIHSHSVHTSTLNVVYYHSCQRLDLRSNNEHDPTSADPTWSWSVCWAMNWNHLSLSTATTQTRIVKEIRLIGKEVRIGMIYALSLSICMHVTAAEPFNRNSPLTNCLLRQRLFLGTVTISTIYYLLFLFCHTAGEWRAEEWVFNKAPVC